MTAIAAREYRQSSHEYPAKVRQAALDRVVGGERPGLVARAMGIPPSTLDYWLDQARRAYLAEVGRRLTRDRTELEAAATRVQQLLDAATLEPPAKRTLQNAITELVAAAMRRE